MRKYTGSVLPIDACFQVSPGPGAARMMQGETFEWSQNSEVAGEIMRILVADDDPTTRFMLGAVLTKAGYTVQEAVDGAGAWDILQTPDAPRLVILDWVMPRMDGIDVLRHTRAAPLELQPYILMVTGKTDKREIIIGLDSGANDYVMKPFDSDELLTRVAVGRRMVDVQQKLLDKNNELSQALSEIRTLRGIIPICASCKSIRDDQGYWNQVEVYVRDHSDAEFSHGLCPVCMKKYYPDVYDDYCRELGEANESGGKDC